MNTTNTIPLRSDIPKTDIWDLSKLFSDDAAWEEGFSRFKALIPKAASFSGSLDQSPESLRDCLEYLVEAGKLSERIGYYAFLRYAEDAGNSDNQSRYSRVMQLDAEFSAATSYIDPEIQAIPDRVINEFLADSSLQDFKIMLQKILRFKPHVLSKEEERLLALEQESAAAPHKAFSALTDVDLEFGTIMVEGNEQTISQSSYGALMINKDRTIRKKAFETFYKGFDAHKNTLASLYAGSIHHDSFVAKARGFASSRAASLFPDNVPDSVYDNLIAAVHEELPALHRYYALRKRILGVEELRHYDVYVPLIGSIETDYTFRQAVDTVIEAVQPLGKEYVSILQAGLLGGWVDKYENRGKRSGAFSAGSYAGDPYILMNYKNTVFRDVFTLAHEAGHSMHSWYSVNNNPFQHYNYSIFEAEVASTCNEQLLAHHLLSTTDDQQMRAYIIGKQIDDIIATIFRQTMFAEYEHIVHQGYEQGTALTVDYFRSTYRSLLETYFGPEMVFESVSDLEGLRIPHFYRAFYVFKYATGLSAALALSQKILHGGQEDTQKYLDFLKSGGSQYPLDSLKTAGVDMSSPEPVTAAFTEFKRLLQEFEGLL
jgi:oligoendopeptidase F